MSYALTLTDGVGNTKQFDSDRLENVDFARTHTGLSDWEATVPYDLALEDWKFAKAELERDTEYLFRGYLEGIESDDGRSTTHLSGRGVGKDLKDGEATHRYQNERAYEAIAHYWSTYTSFSADVVTPQPDTAVTGEVAQGASTSSEWSSLGFASTAPFIIENGRLKLGQTCYFVEAEAAADTNDMRDSDSNASAGERATMYAGTGFYRITTTFSLDYTMPGGNYKVAVRVKNANNNVTDGMMPGFDINVDGTTIGGPADEWGGSGSFSSYRWLELGSDSADLSGSIKVRLDEKSNNADNDLYIDCLALVDTRFSYNYDNSLDSNGYLAGPELYPDAATATYVEESTPWNVTDGYVDVTMAKGSSADALQARVSGGTWFPNDGSEQDATSVSTDFGTEYGTKIQGRVTLSRMSTTRSTATPTTGFEGEQLDSWQLSYDGNSLAVIEDQTFEGDHFSNLQRLHEFAGMRFVINHEPDAKTAESFAAADVTKSLDVITIENRIRKVDVKGYANHVTVRGKEGDDGSRPTRTLQDDSEVSTYGKRHADRTDPTLERQQDVDSAARSLLADKLNQKSKTGRLEIVAANVDPGYSYEVTWSDGTTTTIPLELVSYAESRGNAQGTLVFDLDPDVAGAIAGLRGETERTKNAL